MTHTVKRTKPKIRTRLQPDQRRRLIVEAAFKAIAQEGFEGLRTRDIAAAVGVNSATLHHYFATKQDLIEAIAEHLERRLQAEHAPLESRTNPDPFARQFEDLVFYQREAPDLMAVYREFVARAPRDAVIRDLVGKLHASWKASVVTALTQARARGDVRGDIDLDSAAGIVLSISWGLVTWIFVSRHEFESAAEQLRLLMRPFTKRSRAKHNPKIRQ